MLTFFDPQPAPTELPARLAHPFTEGPPPALARRAAEELQARLRRGELASGMDLRRLDQPGRGKMFGVLVVATADGRVGYLSAFSGMLDEQWRVEGFAPPLFNQAARDAFWPAAEAELNAWDERRTKLLEGAEVTGLREQLAELTARHSAASKELRARHEAQRTLRQEARRHLADADLAEEARAAGLRALSLQSRADDEERRHLERAQRDERAQVASRLGTLEAQRMELERIRAERSRQLWRQIADNYVIPNARGEKRTVGDLYAPLPPPGGAGDCAAPKLLALAFEKQLRPLALAEFWWGAPPSTGDRRSGEFYPACQSKCGVVLPFMLQGLGVDPHPRHATEPTSAELRILLDDPWLIVVDKPSGLVSVPVRQAPDRDSVLVRLRRQCPEAMVLHPLDAEASGLLLITKNPEVRGQLQRQFARREADRRCLALLDGEVQGEGGVIDLPVRTGATEGKRALTAWSLVRRSGGLSRVSLTAQTEWPQQLRVHAADPQGLGAPIVGDRLYGRAGPRLMLHAEFLGFTHPATGKRHAFESPAPF